MLIIETEPADFNNAINIRVRDDRTNRVYGLGKIYRSSTPAQVAEELARLADDIRECWICDDKRLIQV